MNPCLSVKAIVFDADGTIIAFRDSIAKIYQEVFNSFNHKISVDDLEQALRQVWSACQKNYLNSANNYRTNAKQEKEFWQTFVTLLCERVNVEYKEDIFSKAYAAFASDSNRFMRQDALEVIRELKHRGFKVGVFSNHDHRVKAVLSRYRENKTLDFVLTAIDAGYKKPAAESFDYLRDWLGFEAQEILYVGNSRQIDFEGAREAGMCSLLFLERGTSSVGDSEAIESFNELLSLVKFKS